MPGARQAALAIATSAAALASFASYEPRARADEPGPDALPVAVVAIQPDDTDDQAEGLTTALQNTVRKAKGYSLAPGENALEILIVQLKCAEPPDAQCLSRIADTIKADRFVWGVLRKKGELVEGEVNLWSRGKGSARAPVSFPDNVKEATDPVLVKAAEDAFATVSGGPPKSTLRVKSSVAGAQVFLDGQPLGAVTGGDAMFTVPPGEHKVVVRAPGHKDAQGSTKLAPGGTGDVILEPTPVAQATTAAPPTWKKTAGFVALGVGAVSLGAAVFGSVRVASLQNDPEFVRVAGTYETGRNVCDEEKTLGAAGNAKVVGVCDQAGTLQALQFVAYPVGALLVGAGAYLLATSDSGSGSGSAKSQTGKARKPRLDVAPRVDLARRGGGLDLRVRF